MSPSKVLFIFCLALTAGIFLESITRVPQIYLWAFLFVSIFFIFAALIYPSQYGHYILVFGFCVIFFTLGIIRVQISEFNIANDKLSKFNGQQVVITGIVDNEPDVRDTFQKLKVKTDDQPAGEAGSTVLVTINRYPEYKYLDKIKLSGKLETPSVTDTFNYKNYLMKDGIYSVMNSPKVSALNGPRLAGEITVTQKIYSWVLFCKQKIRESIQGNFLPPQSSILEGTILGDNGAMTNDLKSKLNITGLRHVIAVSGTHVVILSAIIMSLLLAMGLWRGQAFYIAIIFICIYIVLTGLPPSGVRAGIMGGLYLFSQHLGRQSMGPRIITIAGAVMLVINPLLLVYDVGFQLSFLAVLGLMYLEPLIKRFINYFTLQSEESSAKELISIVSATFAAQIFTLPIMVYNFGNVSLVSPITNLLILPIVYGLMVFGFLASLAGIFSYALGWILSIPCWLLLTYFVKVIDIFSQPWMAKTITNISWIWVFVAYFVIGAVTWFLNRRYSRSIV
ncbi:MAG: ComEC/Rec2 family competence protein [Candidatus Staskawiczbacteria bacterium]|nr:ComEC/Rec2 family competence protein [Candidatus Staskawiczbacteria bacterium]